MKKFILLLCVLSVLLTGCKVDINPPVIKNGGLKNPLEYKEPSSDVPMEQGISLPDEFCYRYINGISGEFSTAFSSLVSSDELDRFSMQFAGKNPQGTRNIEEYNLITFIRDSNISKQLFIKANSEQRQKNEENKWSQQGTFTQIEIEVLFSDDSGLINKTFVNPNAVLFNGEIYTLQWFANHNVEDYQLVGFNLDMLKSKCDEWLTNELEVPREAVLLVVNNIGILREQETALNATDSRNYGFSAPLIAEYYNIPSKFVELLDNKNEFDAWANKFKSANNGGEFDALDCNILSFIEQFSIAQDRFEMVNDEYRNDGVALYNDEQVDVLYSGNRDMINQYFVNPLALLHKGIIYTPEWFLTNDAQVYKSLALPSDVLQAKCVQWEKENTFAKYPTGISEIRKKITKLEVIK